MNGQFWNGPGGKRHVDNNADREDWQDYRPFFDAAKEAIRPGSRVIELGCSSGYWYERLDLRSLGVTYTGIDISEVAIAEARRRFPECSFYCADVGGGIDLDGFDHILICQTLFFLPRAAVEEILKRVPAGSTLTIYEPIGRDAESQDGISERFETSKVGTVTWHHDYPTLLAEAGLDCWFEIFPVRKGRRKIVANATKDPNSPPRN